MTQFALMHQLTKIDSFTPRAEFDGADERKPAGSVRLTCGGHSSLMDTFFPGLRQVLFRKPDLTGEQLPLIEGDELTQVAFPKLKSLKLGEKWPGYTVQLSEGLEASVPLVLGEATLSNFEFELLAGGAVTVSFSAACHPNAEQAGELCQLVQQDRYLTLIPPTAEAQQSQQQMPLGGAGDTLDQQDAEDEARRLTQMGAAQDDQAKAA